MKHPERPTSSDLGQRAFDLIAASVIVLALLPFLALIAVTVALTSRGPIVFRQRRIGRDGVPFQCWKFRTMQVDAEERLTDLLSRNATARAEWARDHKLRFDPRITRVGYLLRKTSLDELPQLINVLQGRMSLVGPRPIVLAECERYGRYFQAYCSVRPGITGLWQISGRNDVSYRRRVAFDVVYSRRRSVLLDFKILALTLPSVALQKGAY
ncbi:sugar transferase [Sphingomonas guangdongensis]|nr:sugar transferase [Sphingomonas guangdongensis]